MIERSERPRLALEAGEPIGVERGRGQDLQRHVATEPRIARAVDLTHAAGNVSGGGGSDEKKKKKKKKKKR